MSLLLFFTKFLIGAFFLIVVVIVSMVVIAFISGSYVLRRAFGNNGGNIEKPNQTNDFGYKEEDIVDVDAIVVKDKDNKDNINRRP